MKKIIGGKKYDTSTAKEVGFVSVGGPRDFGAWDETLYKKKTGEYFLHGVGGPASKYGVSCGLNEWCGGSQIIPLSISQAKRWAEKYMTCDKYEACLGEVEE